MAKTLWELQVIPMVEAPLLTMKAGPFQRLVCPPASEFPHPTAHPDVPLTSPAFTLSSSVLMSFLDLSRERGVALPLCPVVTAARNPSEGVYVVVTG